MSQEVYDIKLPFIGSYKHSFTFSDGKYTLIFTAEYRSDISPKMSVNDAISEGCEYIYFDSGEGLKEVEE